MCAQVDDLTLPPIQDLTAMSTKTLACDPRFKRAVLSGVSIAENARFLCRPKRGVRLAAKLVREEHSRLKKIQPELDKLEGEEREKLYNAQLNQPSPPNQEPTPGSKRNIRKTRPLGDLVSEHLAEMGTASYAQAWAENVRRKYCFADQVPECAKDAVDKILKGK